MLVDLAHVSDRTFYDALAATTKPVMVSHSSMRNNFQCCAECVDEMLRASARDGGVVGGKIHKSCSESRPTMVATMEDVADHIGHAVKIAGIDHVGIGSDFDGIGGTANGLVAVSKMRALVAVLWKREHAESDLKEILGENFLRVVREVTGASIAVVAGDDPIPRCYRVLLANGRLQCR